MLVLGLTPVWQTTYVVKSLARGELVRSSRVTTFASGKATNAARHAEHVRTLCGLSGDRVELLTPLAGPTGELFRAAAADEMFELHPTSSQSPTRCCTTVLEASGCATELIENSGPLGQVASSEILETIASRTQKAAERNAVLSP